MTEETTSLYAKPWNSDHIHGEWDLGGFCNSLVLDEPDGCGANCGYQLPEMRAIMEANKERERKFEGVPQSTLYRDFDRAMIILYEQTDTNQCLYDHNGGCQEHGYISLEPGQICGTLEAQQILAKYGYTTEGEQNE